MIYLGHATIAQKGTVAICFKHGMDCYQSDCAMDVRRQLLIRPCAKLEGSTTMADVSTFGLMLGSSVIAAALTHGVTAVKDGISTKKTADYSALYLAMTLEAYARECSNMLSESEMALASDDNAGKRHAYLPEFPAVPTTVDWKSLGIEITAMALALPVLIATTNVSIGTTWDLTEEDLALTELHEAGAEIGLQCFALARDVREKRSIPPLALNEKWNAFSHLINKQAEYAGLREKKETSHRIMIRGMDHAADAPDQTDVRG